mgnify:CR=1 FL=1
MLSPVSRPSDAAETRKATLFCDACGRDSPLLDCLDDVDDDRRVRCPHCGETLTVR